MQLFDDQKKRIGVLTGFRNREITTTLSSGDKEMIFEYPASGGMAAVLKAEYYLRTKADEYVIKAIEKGRQFNKYTAVLNVEELEGTTFPYGFESNEQTITACLEFAFDVTGWHVGTCEVKKKRTINEEQSVTAWEVLQKCLSTYRCECIIDSLNKVVHIYEKIGSDKGSYFVEGLNLRNLTPKSDTYDFYTRIYPIGKDGITPEWLTGKDYIDNFQYSSKIKAYVWKDERYTNTTSLIEDATAKIEEMSKPYKAYTAEVIDLARVSAKYKDILSYGIGDTITLISKSTKTKEKQRIVKITEYPETPEMNTIEISNANKTFADVQKEETRAATDEAISIANRATKKILENYSTTQEIETKITASKTEVELGVMHTLQSYYDKTETDSIINASLGEIKLEVSEKYQTKDEMREYSTTSETKSLIDIATDEISIEVSKKVGAEEIISKINQSPEEISIKADKINLHGIVTANENFKILQDGSVEAKNGKFVGTITGSVIQTADEGDRVLMDTTSAVKGCMGDDVINVLDFVSDSDTREMILDAKNMLAIRTPKLGVANSSYGLESGTVTVTKCGKTQIVSGVSKDYNNTKEQWVGEVYCTLPVFLNVSYANLNFIHGMQVTGEKQWTSKI